MAEETEVLTETPETKPAEAPTGKAAFAAARQSIRAQSTDQGTTETAPETDDTKATTPAQEPEKPADEPHVAGEPEDALLTPDEVSQLKPAERKLYEKAQKNYTQKTQKLAAERKEFEDRKALIEAQLAERQTAPAQDTKAIEPKAAEITAPQLPEEWQFLKPLFETYGQQVREQVLASVKGELEPIKQAHTEQLSRAVAAETQSTLEAFSANPKYKDWKTHEPKMMEIAEKFIPAQKGGMNDFEYMEILYKLATADITEAQQTRRAVEKINKAAENAEPATQGVDSSRVEHVMPKGLGESGNRFKAAAKAAQRGERWVRQTD